VATKAATKTELGRRGVRNYKTKPIRPPALAIKSRRRPRIERGPYTAAPRIQRTSIERGPYTASPYTASPYTASPYTASPYRASPYTASPPVYSGPTGGGPGMRLRKRQQKTKTLVIKTKPSASKCVLVPSANMPSVAEHPGCHQVLRA